MYLTCILITPILDQSTAIAWRQYTSSRGRQVLNSCAATRRHCVIARSCQRISSCAADNSTVGSCARHNGGIVASQHVLILGSMTAWLLDMTARMTAAGMTVVMFVPVTEEKDK